MEFMGNGYCDNVNLFESMLKGEKMGCQKSFNDGIEEVLNWLDKQKDRPVDENTPIARVNKSRYLKLYNGDIYDTQSNTVISRKALMLLLDD